MQAYFLFLQKIQLFKLLISLKVLILLPNNFKGLLKVNYKKTNNFKILFENGAISLDNEI